MNERSLQRVIKPGSFAEFYQDTLRKGRQWEDKELFRVRHHLNAWTTYDTSPYLRSNEFSSLLQSHFYDFLKTRKRKKGKVFTLDVMGTGGFNIPENHVVNGEAAITLLDHRSEEKKREDWAMNKEVIAGNVITKAPWDKARAFIEKNDDTQLKGYDLIYCVPIGGWDSLRRSKELQTEHDPLYESYLEQIVLRQSFSLLSQEGGTLVMRMPEEKDYRSWIAQVNSMPGVSASVDFLAEK